jgi:hypothetical protein
LSRWMPHLIVRLWMRWLLPLDCGRNQVETINETEMLCIMRVRCMWCLVVGKLAQIYNLVYTMSSKSQGTLG